MVEIIDGEEQIVMSLGSDKAASRGKLLGLEPAKVYELRTDARKNNDAVKKGLASLLSDRPAPAVTAGSSPESRKIKPLGSLFTPNERPIDNSKTKQGTPSKPVDTEIEVYNTQGKVIKTPAVSFGAIAMNKSPDGDKGYLLTHVESGHAVYKYTYPEKVARKLAQKLAKEDWRGIKDQSVEGVNKDSLERIRDIIRGSYSDAYGR